MPPKTPLDPDRPLSERERELIRRLFRWEEMPVAFKAALVDYASVNGSLHVSSMPTLKGEEWREVGATGQPAFEGIWVAFDSTQKPRFYKDALGIVRLGGAVKSGTLNTTAFTLPEGYRPGYSDTYASSNGATFASYSAGGAFAAVRIHSGGEVRPVVGTTTYISLDVINFRAA